MKGSTTATITNPVTSQTKDFTFDFSYWSHDGFIEESNGRLVPAPHSNYADQVRTYLVKTKASPVFTKDSLTMVDFLFECDNDTDAEVFVMPLFPCLQIPQGFCLSTERKI